MILAIAAGFALRAFAGWNDAPVFGLLAGMVLAPLVPAKAACGLPRRPPGVGEPPVDDARGPSADSPTA